MPDTFYDGGDWEAWHSDRVVTHSAQIGDIWPVGAADGKDELEDGHHMFFALGPTTQRPVNRVGVSMRYFDDAERVVLVLGNDEFAAMAYVANILTYDGGDPATWAASVEAWTPVYIDDSAGVPAGVTLSLSPLNASGDDNPRAGWVVRAPDEEPDDAIGGSISDPFPKAFASDSETSELLLAIMLDPD